MDSIYVLGTYLLATSTLVLTEITISNLCYAIVSTHKRKVITTLLAQSVRRLEK